MAEHGLTAADLAAPAKKAGLKGGPKSGQKVAPKYRDPVSGATWSGRCLRPKWLSAALADGKALTDFAA